MKGNLLLWKMHGIQEVDGSIPFSSTYQILPALQVNPHNSISLQGTNMQQRVIAGI